ncbi:hypothetical protein [Microbacterium oxydans]|uniref:hypothetical protein n=1 Tax=Microbacterium oxydans TaxID=82380 RepID=UPI00366F1CBB
MTVLPRDDGDVPETPRLILNRTSETPRVLHREDCPTIQHQARGDIREELPRAGYQVLESYEDGRSLVGPVEGVDRNYYEALYVTVDELQAAGRYRRCKVCAPDAPDGPPPESVTRKKAEGPFVIPESVVLIPDSQRIRWQTVTDLRRLPHVTTRLNPLLSPEVKV